jgi:hypothetical protein
LHATWRSQDGQATVELLAGLAATLLLSLNGLLDMELSRGFEEDLIVEQPVQFLNLEIRGMTHSPDVHGVSQASQSRLLAVSPSV